MNHSIPQSYLAKETLLQTLLRQIGSFFTKPQPVEILGIFRIGIAAFALVQVALLWSDWFLYYGPKGLLPWSISEALATKHTPSLWHVSRAVAWLHLSDNTIVYIISMMYVAALLALVAGFYTRLAGILAWLCHLLLNTAAQMNAYGVVTFTHIALFYCMVLPVGASISIDARGRYKKLPPYLITLSIRVVQLHLCIMYCASGIEKASGEQWWSGEAIWLSLQQDQFRQFDTGWVAEVPLIPRMMGWATLVVEGLYPLGIYLKQTKKIWLCAIVGMHLFIMVFLGLYLFGSLMIILNLAMFGYHAFPRLFARLFFRQITRKKKENLTAPAMPIIAAENHG